MMRNESCFSGEIQAHSSRQRVTFFSTLAVVVAAFHIKLSFSFSPSTSDNVNKGDEDRNLTVFFSSLRASTVFLIRFNYHLHSLAM